MGCFLACFGSSNNHKHSQHRRRSHRRLNHVSSAADPNPRNRCTPTGIPLASTSKQDYLQKSITSIEDSGVKEKEQLSSSKPVQSDRLRQLSSGTRKKVTFDSNITVYERVSVDEFAVVLDDPGLVDENGFVADSAEPSNSASAKPCSLVSASEKSSSSSSLGSYRYQNCRESDDEDEYEYEYEDADELAYEDDEFFHEDTGKVISHVSFPSLESRTKSSNPSVVDTVTRDTEYQAHDGGKKMLGSECNAQDRSCYVNVVLNPVENTAQWRTLKAKETGALKVEKENLFSQEEPPLLLVGKENPSLKQSLVNFSSKLEEPPEHDEEIEVNASLSSWLVSSVSSEKTPQEKTKAADLDTIPSARSEEGERSMFPASSMTKRSTIRNLADVRACWNNASPAEECSSVSMHTKYH